MPPHAARGAPAASRSAATRFASQCARVLLRLTFYLPPPSKSALPHRYIWESKADGNFAISPDTEGAPLGRGTQINIYLKDTAQEYLQQDKLKELVARYSEFINFPIYLLTESSVEKEVPLEGEELAAAEAAEAEAAAAKADKSAEKGKSAEDAAEGETVEVSGGWRLLLSPRRLWGCCYCCAVAAVCASLLCCYASSVLRSDPPGNECSPPPPPAAARPCRRGRGRQRRRRAGGQDQEAHGAGQGVEGAQRQPGACAACAVCAVRVPVRVPVCVRVGWEHW